MQFIKQLLKDNSVIGLSGLRKKNIEVNIPTVYKKTFVPNTEKNYLLI